MNYKEGMYVKFEFEDEFYGTNSEGEIIKVKEDMIFVIDNYKMMHRVPFKLAIIEILKK